MENAKNVLGRRDVIVSAAGGVGVFALASCGSAEDTPPASGPEAAALTKLSGIPVGGAVSVTGPDNEQIIVAQPQPGTVRAFKAACTHKGCPVSVAQAELHCPCHGAKFDSATGEVLNGPAEEPLAPVQVHLDQQGTVRTGSA
ncbi:Rieske Fe-S protein [Saccharopolyspora erythraea NRRL 2338]|uniref:Cytochrome bc1 complex Rieske iron-sulfur subunit n=2 Tax=Saccharopolyspora erythraea TaxID=1836 RepID=A4FCJ2_SACEN|nr:Rieske (2Fe-2S) protein [Saccharopolyspora erythraea]EQD87473.1 FeS-binding protein [Saccharopolyspora erythraea D]PFG95531.1 Rieske Fe-S protein [Saccharopolyspora erythraea NRRL 2338]QRK92155.1 Rieske (2Fe-2S) protein [Saccharopolyspora erythraea]CAM01767.1 iron sulphur binding protein [Saccharopolyspora erythraea NRRL 2338]